MRTVIIFNWGWMWEKGRPFLLAAVWFWCGFVWFREPLWYESERRVNHALAVSGAAIDGHRECQGRVDRMLYGLGVRRGDIEPDWLGPWAKLEEP